MNDETHDNLSPQGVLRRAAMLGELTASMTRLHRARRTRRRAVSATAVILVFAGVVRLISVSPQQFKVVKVEPPEEPQPILMQPPPTPGMQVVHTDPQAADRFRPMPQPVVVTINDAQLVRTLIEIGRPAGLIHIGERIALSAPVTDEELHIPQ